MLQKILISCILLFSVNAVADTVQVGQVLPTIALQNQHGKPVKVTNEVKTILFAVEKAPSDLINAFLMKQDATFLAQQKAYFVADISGIPAFVTSMFAIPKMKKRPYDILLAKDAAQVAFIPRKKNRVSVLNVVAGKVQAVDFVENMEQLKQAFAVK